MTEVRLTQTPVVLLAYAVAGASGACIATLAASATTISDGGSLFFAMLLDPINRLKIVAGLGAVFGVALGTIIGPRPPIP